MSPIDDVLRRLAADPAFRAEVERDPAAALDGLDLTHEDLSRIDAALRERGTSLEHFFAEPSPDPSAP